MWQWACGAQLQCVDFFSFRRQWSLLYKVFNKAIKLVAQNLGFGLERFHTHSPRVAGASALIASGATEAIIKLMGQWRSLAFLQYILLELSSFDRALKALSADEAILGIEDVKRLAGG